MYRSYLIYFLLRQLFYYVSFFFLVTFSNDLLIPVPIVNTKVKEEPARPAGVSTLKRMKLYLTYQIMLTKQ